MTGPLILPYAGITPRAISPKLGAGAALLGRVTLGRQAAIGVLAVLRADGNHVTTGDDVHIGPRSTLHITHEELPCILGDRVTVGTNACVHACIVGNDVFIGDDVVILDGTVIEDEVILENGATVYPGKRLAGGHIYAGSPAKPVRPVAPNEVAERAAVLRRQSNDSVTPRQTPGAGSHIDPSVFIASTASVKGRVEAAPSSSIWFSNDFNAGPGVIRIGDRTNIQDNTVIRCSTENGFAIGHDSTIGHNVLLHDCTIGSHTLIGIGATVAPGSLVEDHVLLAAKARTEPGQVLDSGWLYAGAPARKLAPLDAGKRTMIAGIVEIYCQYAQDFKQAEHDAIAQTASF